jgi:hypothetical protein
LDIYFLILTNVVDPDPLHQGQDLLLNPVPAPDFRETKVKDLPVKETFRYQDREKNLQPSTRENVQLFTSGPDT